MGDRSRLRLARPPVDRRPLGQVDPPGDAGQRHALTRRRRRLDWVAALGGSRSSQTRRASDTMRGVSGVPVPAPVFPAPPPARGCRPSPRSDHRPARRRPAGPRPAPRHLAIIGPATCTATSDAAYLAETRPTCGPAAGGRIVLLDGGDMFQGTLDEPGRGQIGRRGLRRWGYAAVAVGNHEYDFGPAEARGAGPADRRPARRPSGALGPGLFPFLASNLTTACARAGRWRTSTSRC
jgi:hypothetical protein